MALILENKTNAQAPNLAYPYGNIGDDTGVGDGVPVNKEVYADFHQFFARLIDQANNPAIVINDLPDNFINGFQYYNALLATKTNHSITNESNIAANLLLIQANTVEIKKNRALLGEYDFGAFAF